MDIQAEKYSIIKQISQIDDIESLMELRLLLSTFKITPEDNEIYEVPEWQKTIVRNRLKDNEGFVDAKEMLERIRKKYSIDTL